MDGSIEDRREGSDEEGGLLDLTGMPLPDLMRSESSALAIAIRRLLAQVDRPQQYAAFSNCPALSGGPR